MPSAIVTGGSVRLGRGMALHLAEKRYAVALHYGSSEQQAEESADEIRSYGVRCHTYACDFTDLEAVGKFMETVSADFDDIELLLNSAANFIQENVENTSTKTLIDSFNINLFTPYILMRDYKRRINRGMIVNILDERILKTIPTFAAYSMTKVALSHLTHLAAVEWGETVRVNAIAPGLILPPAGQSDDYLIRGAKQVPTKTYGTVEDIQHALEYLITSKFVNGETLYVDGGTHHMSRE
mgnify:FL=1